MKPMFLFLSAVLAFLANVGEASEMTEIERAIRELPPAFVADIPIEARETLMRRLQRDSSTERLDLKSGFLHYFSDNSGEGVGATSMLYMKQYRRADGGHVILTHMPKPFADGSAPRKNQTFVLERRKKKWKDVTDEVFPIGIDRTAHFRPRRNLKVVEVAPYVRIERRDGKGEAWQFGPHTAELHWNGEVFLKREPAKDARAKE